MQGRSGITFGNTQLEEQNIYQSATLNEKKRGAQNGIPEDEANEDEVPNPRRLRGKQPANKEPASGSIKERRHEKMTGKISSRSGLIPGKFDLFDT